MSLQVATDSVMDVPALADLVTLAYVEPRPVDWLWTHYLPCGTVALLSGEPGVGKTYLAMAIAAAVTRPVVRRDSTTGDNPDAQPDTGPRPVVSTAGSTRVPPPSPRIRFPQPATPRPEPTSLDLAAEPALSVDDWRPETGPAAANVVYVTAESSPEQVLRPRLDVLGGDPRRLYVLRGFTNPRNQAGGESRTASGAHSEDHPTAPASGAATGAATVRQPIARAKTGRARRGVRLSDLQALQLIEDALRQTRARLLVIDPLESYLPAGTRPQEIRFAMDELTRLAQEYSCCILLLRQLGPAGKGRRASAPLELTGAVRTELLAACWPENPPENPEDPARRVLVQLRSTLGPLAPAVGYSISVEGAIEGAAEGAFHWNGPSDLTARTLLAPAQNSEQKSAVDEAVQFLEVVLGDGPKIVSDVRQEAKELGISPATLQRAKPRLGVITKKTGGYWKWALPHVQEKVLPPPPPEPVPDPQDCEKVRRIVEKLKEVDAVKFGHLTGAAQAGHFETVVELMALNSFKNYLVRREEEAKKVEKVEKVESHQDQWEKSGIVFKRLTKIYQHDHDVAAKKDVANKESNKGSEDTGHVGEAKKIEDAVSLDKLLAALEKTDLTKLTTDYAAVVDAYASGGSNLSGASAGASA